MMMWIHNDKLYLVLLTVLCLFLLARNFFLVRRLRKMKKRERRNTLLLEQLSQNQKMDTIGRLAGGVAHDFNNMLAGINGAAEMLETKLGADHPLRHYTDIILKACKRAANLTSELLVFSRNKGTSCEDMDLHECIEESINLLKPGIGKKIAIRKSLRASEHFVNGNHDMIQNMILNLGINARDAMVEGGTITIKTRSVELTGRKIQKTTHKIEPGKFVELIIKDVGPGIPDDIKNKIFDPFFTTKEVGKGTGLGLPAVYGIVSEHNATMKLETSAKGTTFHIYFPVVAGKQKKQKREGKIKEIKAKILIVDDESLLLELLKDMLDAVGAEVVSTSKPTEAIEIYKKHQDIDVVMLDVIMPAKNGFEVYDELKKINPEVRVVFMSGYTNDSKINHMVKNQKNIEFIRKPYMMKEITAKVSKLLKVEK